MISPGEWKKFCEPWKADNHLCEVSIPNREIAAGRGYGSHQTWNRLFWKKCKNLDGIKTGEDKTGGKQNEKINNGKDMAVRSRPVGWALLSGIISNWLVYFYQPDETAISQGQTVFIPQGLVIFGVFTIIGGITAFGRIFDAFTDPMIASWSDRCTSKNGRRIPFLKGASLPLALSTVLVFWSPVNENSWINAAFLFGMILAYYLSITHTVLRTMP